MTTEPVKDHDKHWLVRKSTIKGLWVGGIIILALTVVAELFIHPHPHFEVDGWFGFNAWYGFITCAAMVFGAKALGYLVKREDTYYDE